MITHTHAIALVPKPQGIEIVKHRNGITEDIITSIVEIYKNHHAQVFNFAQLFKANTIGETIALIHQYIRQNIKYKLDRTGEQLIKRPSAIIHNAEGDCKAYSILAGSILKSLKIPFSFRFVSYKVGKPYSHIYIIVGKEETPLDACLPSPFVENRYTTKKDIDMSKIAEIGQIGCSTCQDNKKCNCSQKPETPNKQKAHCFKIGETTDMSQNPYAEEIAGIFSKKEGGTKLGNMLRAAAPIITALPIPGAGLAAKVMTVGKKVFNVVDKVSKLPKAVPLNEVINRTLDTANSELDKLATEPQLQQSIVRTETTTEKPNNMIMYAAAAAAAYMFLGGKKGKRRK
jgi:hypothetical protein